MPTLTSPFARSRLFDIPITTAGDAVAALAHLQGYSPPPGLIATILTHDSRLTTAALHYADGAPDPAGLAELIGGGEPGGTIVVGSGTPEDIGRVIADHARAVAAYGPITQRVCGIAEQHWALDVDGNAQDPAGVVQRYTETAFHQSAAAGGSAPFPDPAGMRYWLETPPEEQRARVEAGVAAAEHVLGLLMQSPLGCSEDMVSLMRRVIDIAATASHLTGAIPDATTASIYAWLGDDRMAELLNAFTQLPDRDTVLRVCAELARLAPKHRRAAAATHLGFAALTHGDLHLATMAIEMAAAALEATTSGASELRGRIGYLHAVLDATGVRMRPPTYDDALDVAEAALRAPVFAAFRLSEILALCEATVASATYRDLPGPSGAGPHPGSPAGSGPALWWRGTDLTSNAEPAPEILHPIEESIPDANLPGYRFPVEIYIDQELVDTLRDTSARGAEQICLHHTPTRVLITDHSMDQGHDPYHSD